MAASAHPSSSCNSDSIKQINAKFWRNVISIHHIPGPCFSIFIFFQLFLFLFYVYKGSYDSKNFKTLLLPHLGFFATIFTCPCKIIVGNSWLGASKMFYQMSYRKTSVFFLLHLYWDSNLCSLGKAPSTASKCQTP